MPAPTEGVVEPTPPDRPTEPVPLTSDRSLFITWPASFALARSLGAINRARQNGQVLAAAAFERELDFGLPRQV